MNDRLSARQAAREYQLNVYTVRKWIERGLIESEQDEDLGNIHTFTRSDFESFLAKKRSVGRPKGSKNK